MIYALPPGEYRRRLVAAQRFYFDAAIAADRKADELRDAAALARRQAAAIDNQLRALGGPKGAA